jgi:hypothetical protein
MQPQLNVNVLTNNIAKPRPGDLIKAFGDVILVPLDRAVRSVWRRTCAVFGEMDDVSLSSRRFADAVVGNLVRHVLLYKDAREKKPTE